VSSTDHKAPHYAVLEHSQATFLHQCERPHFTPIQKTGKIIVLYSTLQKYHKEIQI